MYFACDTTFAPILTSFSRSVVSVQPLIGFGSTNGDKLARTMSWPDQKAEKLKDLKLKDGTLTFSAVRKIRDNKIPVDYKLKIDGDKIKGKGSAEFGGEKREWDIQAKREKKKDQ
jgi:hypothetical protein